MGSHAIRRRERGCGPYVAAHVAQGVRARRVAVDRSGRADVAGDVELVGRGDGSYPDVRTVNCQGIRRSAVGNEMHSGTLGAEYQRIRQRRGVISARSSRNADVPLGSSRAVKRDFWEIRSVHCHAVLACGARNVKFSIRQSGPDSHVPRPGVPRVRPGLRPDVHAGYVDVLPLDHPVLRPVGAAVEYLGKQRSDGSLRIRNAGRERGVGRLDGIHERALLSDGQSGGGRGKDGRGQDERKEMSGSHDGFNM